MPKIEIEAVPPSSGCSYPDPFREICLGPSWRKLGDAVGLTDFGVNLVRLPPGKWSSQRHWHTHEDEFVWMLEGEVVLVEDGGETVLRAGDVAAWPKGVKDGHHLQNRAQADCVMIAISAGDTASDWGEYPDIDLKFDDRRPGSAYLHKDGTPYPPKD